MINDKKDIRTRSGEDSKMGGNDSQHAVHKFKRDMVTGVPMIGLGIAKIYNEAESTIYPRRPNRHTPDPNLTSFAPYFCDMKVCTKKVSLFPSPLQKRRWGWFMKNCFVKFPLTITRVSI
jgi:hypothetical protein